jgi:CHRD domain
MRAKLIMAALAPLSVSLAACGGGGSKSSSTRPGGGSPPIRVYRTSLSGAANRPPGAPRGTGSAVIALHKGPTLCWRFAHLHGFTRPTSASLHLGPSGGAGKEVIVLSRGRRLRHQGCVRISAALNDAIELAPANYYLTISSKRYPAGAVRAQL